MTRALPMTLLLLLGACGGGGEAAHEPPATAGSEAPPQEEAPPPLAECVDPAEGAVYYLYLGPDAFVIATPDVRERVAVEGDLEAIAQAAVREHILRPTPDVAAVHVVTDAYATEDARERVLAVLTAEGVQSADHCRATAASPFPSAEEALFATR